MTAAVVVQHHLGAATAMQLVQAAIGEAERQGLRIAAVAVDAAGLPLAALRMDGVNEAFMTAASDKAWTAAAFRRSTDALRQRMADDELRAGAATRSRMLLWGGGLPVLIDGVCVGAIGVSGGLVAQDIACAKAALAVYGLA
jgi:uncharacterized protein GlcG (DUF336 family)